MQLSDGSKDVGSSELKSQVVRTHPGWMLGNKLGSSGKGTCDPNHSPAPKTDSSSAHPQQGFFV